MLMVSISAATSAKQIDVKFLTIDEYKLVANDTTLIDVRSVNSRSKSKMGLPNSVWINPYSGPELEKFITSSDKDKSYVVFCSCTDDNYSIRAAQLLTKNGFKNVTVLKGGWDAIVKSGLPTEPLQKEDN
jgi:rhodanese-related sulfurtransferase